MVFSFDFMGAPLNETAVPRRAYRPSAGGNPTRFV